MIASASYQLLCGRATELKRRYLPTVKATGRYTAAEQDHMRALRLLVHAEIEHYLEEQCELLAGDLERELAHRRDHNHPVNQWASRAVREARIASGGNNGVGKKYVKAMFDSLGICEELINDRNSLLLDRLTAFGKSRGEVAHHSAVKASYQLNRNREEASIDEIVRHLGDLDALVRERRLSVSLP